MMRPRSILHYERIYAASILLGLLSLLVVWPAMQAQLAASPVPRNVIGAVVLVSVLVGLAINLLLLWLTARKANDVARIVVAVFFALGIVSGVWAVLNGSAVGVAALFRVVQIVLETVMLYLLFVPVESKAWFSAREPIA